MGFDRRTADDDVQPHTLARREPAPGKRTRSARGMEQAEAVAGAQATLRRLRSAAISGFTAARDEAEPDAATPGGCPRALQSAGPTTIPAADFDLRIWRQDPVSGAFSELTQCAGCSTTAAASGSRRLTVALPPRGAGDVPPVRYWVMPVLRPNNIMAPSPGTPAAETNVASQDLTGNVIQTTSGCAHFDDRIAAGIYCDAKRDYWKVNYLKSIAVTGVGGRAVSLFATPRALLAPLTPTHLAAVGRRRTFDLTGTTWATSDPEALPFP